jgi:hypothetical protein
MAKPKLEPNCFVGELHGFAKSLLSLFLIIRMDKSKSVPSGKFLRFVP